jgi:hypothetical protein
MPSHIFTRVGYWKESLASNIASVRAVEDYNEDEQGREVIDEMGSVTGFNPTVRRGGLRDRGKSGALCSETRRLEGRSKVASANKPLPLYRCNYSFASAIGAARSDDSEAVRGELSTLAELRG